MIHIIYIGIIYENVQEIPTNNTSETILSYFLCGGQGRGWIQFSNENSKHWLKKTT